MKEMSINRLLLILGLSLILLAVVLFAVVFASGYGYNETGYTCDYLTNGTRQFYYCELKLGK